MLSGFDPAINRGPSIARKPKKHRREKGSVPSVLGGEAINLSSGRRGREFATVVEQRLRPGSREGKKRERGGKGKGGGRREEAMSARDFAGTPQGASCASRFVEFHAKFIIRVNAARKEWDNKKL